jgi:hypothetical protein
VEQELRVQSKLQAAAVVHQLFNLLFPQAVAVVHQKALQAAAVEQAAADLGEQARLVLVTHLQHHHRKVQAVEQILPMSQVVAAVVVVLLE